MRTDLQEHITPKLVAAMDLPNRRAVQSLGIYFHVDRHPHHSIGQIAEAKSPLLPTELEMVRSAQRSIDIEMTRPGPAESVKISAELTKFMALTVSNWSLEQRKEWMAAALDEISEIPYLLAMPGIAEARRVVDFPNKLVPWLFDHVAKKLGKLIEEKRIIDTILEVEDARS